MLGLDIHRQLAFPQHLAGRRSHGRYHGLGQSLPDTVGQPQIVGDSQQVDDLVRGREKEHIQPAVGQIADVLRQRADVCGQVPAVDLDAKHRGSAGFQAGDQAGVRLAVFLQGDDLVGHGHRSVDRLQHLPPRVRLGHAKRRRQTDLFHRGRRFRPAGDGDDVRQRIEVPLLVHVAADNRQQFLESDTGHKHDDIDIAGDQPMREIDRRAVVVQRSFAQGRADMGNSAVFFDQAGDILRPPALKRSDLQSTKIRGRIVHASHRTY